ncbi:hypothetical protein A7982_13174 [Minicystis rosea]|nr:hypothetical protein A7982_13174 [Minicystis rosea]
MKIDNTVALVTGANRSIGRVLVLRDAGAKRVYAAARRPEQGCVDARSQERGASSRPAVPCSTAPRTMAPFHG